MRNSGRPVNSPVRSLDVVALWFMAMSRTAVKLVVHVVALHGFQAHFLWNHLTVLVRKHIILFRTHRTDNMSGGCQNPLDKGVLTGCNLGPVCKGVALQVGMEIQQIVQQWEMLSMMITSAPACSQMPMASM